MAVAWGDFESMSVHYLKELAKRGEHLMVFFCKTDEQVYGVGYLWEFASMVEMSETKKYRLVSAMGPDEFMGLLIARFMDFTPEVESVYKKKDLPAGEQPGDHHTPVDD